MYCLFFLFRLFLGIYINTEWPKKMYTHKVNIPYHNVSYFWDILYMCVCVECPDLAVSAPPDH
jgi:hypothetical protein